MASVEENWHTSGDSDIAIRAQRRREGSPRNDVWHTADHDRQGQAAHRQYKSRTVVELASAKSHA